MKTFRRLFPVIALLAASACLPATYGDGSADPSLKTVAPATITVQNQNGLDLVVYAVNGAQRQRLGMVTSLGTSTFRIPRTAMSNGEVRLLVDPVGSNQAYLNDPIAVQPGQRVSLDVGQNLASSFLAVRP